MHERVTGGDDGTNHSLRTKAEQSRDIVPNIKQLPNYYPGLCQDILSFRAFFFFLRLKLFVKCFGTEAEHPVLSFFCMEFLPDTL